MNQLNEISGQLRFWWLSMVILRIMTLKSSHKAQSHISGSTYIMLHQPRSQGFTIARIRLILLLLLEVVQRSMACF